MRPEAVATEKKFLVDVELRGEGPSLVVIFSSIHSLMETVRYLGIFPTDRNIPQTHEIDAARTDLYQCAVQVKNENLSPVVDERVQTES